MWTTLPRPFDIRNNDVGRDQILEKLRERILRFAASRIGSQGSAPGAAPEDIAQEVLMVLHEKYPDVEAMEELVPLAMEIARLKLMAARRKSARRGEYARVAVDATGGDDPEEGALQIVSEQPGPEAQTEQRELVEQLERAMEQLSGRCRDLFRMKLEGLTFPEIRERLEVDSINTIYTWDFRCRKQMKEKMAQFAPKTTGKEDRH